MCDLGHYLLFWTRAVNMLFLVIGQKPHTCFLATDEEKLCFALDHKNRMPQVAVCHLRLCLELQFTCSLGHFLFLRPKIKILIVPLIYKITWKLKKANSTKLKLLILLKLLFPVPFILIFLHFFL